MPNTKYQIQYTIYNLLSTKVFKLWIVPLVISVGLFLAIRPALAQLVPEGQPSLVEYLKVNSLEVGVEKKDDFSQIYYIYNTKKVFITDARYTKSNPVTQNEYIAWMAQLDSGWRIFLYHIPTGVTTQLTQSGINVNPVISGNKVAWEGQDSSGVWQIFVFDGIKIIQVTTGDMSLNPSIDGNFVAYGRKDLAGWRAALFSLTEKKEKDIVVGDLYQSPKLKAGKIILRKDGKGTEEFGLAPEDLFTLDLAPLTSDSLETPETVTVEEILAELEAEPIATDSGIMEELSPTVVASPSATPEVTP